MILKLVGDVIDYFAGASSSSRSFVELKSSGLGNFLLDAMYLVGQLAEVHLAQVSIL